MGIEVSNCGCANMSPERHIIGNWEKESRGLSRDCVNGKGEEMIERDMGIGPCINSSE